ncbi:lipopolysaccharide biosynthesis protein [Desulfosporosinus youngiae]|uniref:Membrane protein involved in the export of O-antigen and teichoic acid n=1 Tax=Desulfosporosinus youngiae DSM 17734 TaxID=768710 RepID=H5XUD9_9FIRM|nr:lipopolysaccharide biosynthesis protein [Desulfosporosinus youngiae]EHQ89375.1 membrane protein involved in the export of O-antigen and teichoic acid [Desulfosporosinus youngiae DSM 17734]
MKDAELKEKMIKATKWSALTEIVAKLVIPVTNMILARLLTPEAFGIVAIVTMIISFTDMFADAGFQKYLVQHEFKSKEEKDQKAAVAFWTNLGISLFLWSVIALFCEPIATIVGNPGLGNVITIACIQLPLTSFSSIQIALYKRDFNYKTLFLVRIISIGLPFTVTIPLAILGFSHWALIIGSICGQLSNAIILTVNSNWKPTFFYRFTILKEMLSFCIWSLIEAISIWLTTWADSIIIASAFSSYYLGLYRTSTNMVNSLMGIITAATTSVLFSTLSRLQDDDREFNRTFLKIQRIVSIIIFPLGVGVFLYSDLAVQFFLGSQWKEATGIIGIWALAQIVRVVFCYYCSEVYRARGRPKLSFLVQVLYALVLIPTCIISSKYGFEPFIYARSATVIEFALVHLLVMNFAIGISTFKIIKNVYPAAASAIAMGLGGYYLQQVSEGAIWRGISIIICIILYFGLSLCFQNTRKGIVEWIKRTAH